ncbi:lytic transglycosylase domain-containing protein [Escherichia coli]
MFIPPADDVKPIPVPVEVYTQCITDASRFFGIDAELVFTLFDNEGGKVGTFSRNKNGTYDIGHMQINSSNLPEIRGHFPSVTWRVLAYDACASFWVGTWWLYRKIVDRNGNVFEGIADYNSKTPKVRARYIFNFMVKYNRRIQGRNGMDELYQWTQPKTQYNGHIVKNVPE